jgi:hypothetical protein
MYSFGGVVQWISHPPEDQKIVGSNPYGCKEFLECIHCNVVANNLKCMMCISRNKCPGGRFLHYIHCTVVNNLKCIAMRCTWRKKEIKYFYKECFCKVLVEPAPIYKLAWPETIEINRISAALDKNTNFINFLFVRVAQLNRIRSPH